MSRPQSLGWLALLATDSFLSKAYQGQTWGQVWRFLELPMKLQMNILLLGAISEMPCCAKFLKEMLPNKRKLQENAMVSPTDECSKILQNKLPP